MKNQTSRTLILGKSGSGKSHLAKSQLRKYKGNYFVYDTLGEYNGSGILFTNFEDLERFWVEHVEFYKIVYQPLQPKEEFDYIASLVYSVGDCLFLVEELDTFCSPYEFSLDFANIIQRGRHVGIDFIGVSQRPYGINRTISAQCKEIISFQMSEPRDIAFLSTYMGEDVEAIRKLGQYEYLKWNNGHITKHSPAGVIQDFRSRGGTPQFQEEPEEEELEEIQEDEKQEKSLTEDE